jgi:hypothetical protein
MLSANLEQVFVDIIITPITGKECNMTERIKVFEAGMDESRRCGHEKTFGEILEDRVNAWLAEHPDITVQSMHQSAFPHDEYCAVLLTVWYTEPSAD